MLSYPLILPFIFGTLFGSFANVCILRLPLEEDVVHGRSRCPHCQSLIHWYDNMPLLSWVLLLGRCRACRGSISYHYPLVELTTGVGFAAAFYVYGGYEAAAACAFVWSLIVIFGTDISHRIIPNEISYTFLFLGLALAPFFFLGKYNVGILEMLILEQTWSWAPSMRALLVSVAGAVVGGGIILSIRVFGGLVYGKESMGLGDVKLMAYIGAWLGLTGTLYAIFVGVIIGGFYSMYLLFILGADRKSYIPFGPFLGVGALIVLYFHTYWLSKLFPLLS